MTDLTDHEHALRAHLDRHTDAVPGGPDLGRSLREGRRRRRTRALAVVTAGTAAAVVVATVAIAGLDGSDSRVTDPSTGSADAAGAAGAGAPAGPTDFVAGTRIDERFAALVAEHLPALPAPDDVYPSDADTRGPIPDAEFASATDWQAVYTVAPGHRLLVLMGYPVPGEDPAPDCAGVPRSQCSVEPRPGGGMSVTQRYTSEDGFTFFASDVDADGFQVNLLDTSSSPRRTLEEVRGFRELVADPRFTFEQGS